MTILDVNGDRRYIRSSHRSSTPMVIDHKKHAKRRLMERYGLSANRHDIQQMVTKIHDGTAELLIRQSHTRAIYRLNFRGVNLYAVYSRTSKTIVTFLSQPQVNELMEAHEVFGRSS